MNTAVTACPGGLSLQSPLTSLHGVGESTARRLQRLGLTVIGDLLFHLPLRYQDRTRLKPLGALQAGDEVLVEGEVLLSQVRYGRRRTLLARIGDGTGYLTLRFFYFSTSQQQALASGQRFSFYGEVRTAGNGELEMIHPEYRHVNEPGGVALATTLTPVYPVTEGLGQAVVRKLVQQVLTLLRRGQLAAVEELLPAQLLGHLHLPELTRALQIVHQPPPGEDVALLRAARHPSQRRLAFEELLVQQLAFRRLHRSIRQHAAPSFAAAGRLPAALMARLPFTLTAAQQRVIADVQRDVQRRQPMQRLVQGDVGSGKTVVAAIAALMAVEAGYQAVIMAPTELLAEQHFRSFQDWLQELDVHVSWLSGKLKGRRRSTTLDAIASGRTEVIIGTHALFQDDVEFNRLGLVVIDEQHRFGVQQRLALRQKGQRRRTMPHQLVMSATPIPRTMVMAAYADLETSVIDELPPGRRPVQTVIVSDQRRGDVVRRVESACEQGRQVYWVCTLIEESEALQCQAAVVTAAELQQALPGLSVALVHGRLKAEEKEAVMQAFKQGDIDVLVATTVIEVGVDVANASLMIIENAERLGLAQLHQLRGRVGRGQHQSSCVLMYNRPLSQRGRQRLAILRETSDGFIVAQRDLEMRGPGDVLGTRQTGLLQFRIADMIRDQDLLMHANQFAGRLFDDSPQLVERLLKRWHGDALHFGAV